MMLQNATVRVKSELFTAGTEEHVDRLGTTPDNLARSVPPAENLRNIFIRHQQLGQNIDNQILSCVSLGLSPAAFGPADHALPGIGSRFKMPGVKPTIPVQKISTDFVRQRLPSSQFGLGIRVLLSF